jgi:hypothetical protein
MADAGIGAFACIKRACVPGRRVCRTTRDLFLLLFPSSLRQSFLGFGTLILIFGGMLERFFRGGMCSAWSGARAMAADVSYPDVVRYGCFSHPFLCMTTRIIPRVTAAAAREASSVAATGDDGAGVDALILMCHLEVVALFACLSTSYKHDIK